MWTQADRFYVAAQFREVAAAATIDPNLLPD